MDIFTPITIRNYTIKSRLIRSATAERVILGNLKERDYLIDTYINLVKGEVGLIITGHIAVHPSGQLYETMPIIGQYINAKLWEDITKEIRKAGGILIAQLNHGGGRCPEDVEPFCVSKTSVNNREEMIGKELTDNEIQILINSFSASAAKAIERGFFGVQIHAAHGYLISQFLSPLTNKRKDKWGGSLENRAAFLINVVKKTRLVIGDKMLLGVKLGAFDDLPNGLTVEETLEIATALEKEGIDFLEISGAFRADLVKRRVLPGKNDGYHRDIAKKLKDRLHIPIAVVGGFRSFEFINETLTQGYVDMISMSRPLICEPNLLLLFKEGRAKASKCIGCNRCLLTKDGFTRCHLPESH